MKTPKKDIYNCIYIEGIWGMLKYFHIYSNNARIQFWSKDFITASASLDYSFTSKRDLLSFKDRLEIYKYIRSLITLECDNFNYIVRAYISTLFTKKPLRVAYDITTYAIKRHPIGSNFDKLDALFGCREQDIDDDTELMKYLEAKGYDVEYGRN